MWSRWRIAASRLSSSTAANRIPVASLESAGLFSRTFSKSSSAAAAAAAAASTAPPPQPSAHSTASKRVHDRPETKLNAMFWSRPCSLVLAPDSPLRVEEPRYEGLKHLMLTLMLFYSKESKSIRGANVVYRRVLSQVDKPAIYDVFQLEKTFKTTFALLVLHMWLILRRLKEEGKEGSKFGQYLYEIYSHNLELRVSKAGVNLLLTKHLKDLERIFYGNIVAYDGAISPEARNDDLANVIWRNIFSEGGSDTIDDAAVTPVQALARYTRRESTCLSLTDKDALYSGNFMFTPLSSQTSRAEKPAK